MRFGSLWICLQNPSPSSLGSLALFALWTGARRKSEGRLTHIRKATIVNPARIHAATALPRGVPVSKAQVRHQFSIDGKAIAPGLTAMTCRAEPRQRSTSRIRTALWEHLWVHPVWTF